MSARLAIDIGGTFTDFVLVDGKGVAHTHKTLTSPDDHARAIAEGLSALIANSGVPPASIAQVLHATTLGSNTLIERTGARTGLVTTRGFRDVLEIRDLRMPRLYDLSWEKPKPLVPRRWRRTVVERVRVDGTVDEPLDGASVVEAARVLKAAGVESVAVCLVNAYADGSHERRVAEILADVHPAADISLSHVLLPEIGEYPRTSTTVVNAYVRPVIRRYVARLEGVLADAGFDAPLFFMQSNGGLIPAELAAEAPVNIIESGPAAGVVGAAAVAARAGAERLITLDIGGTTAKAAMVEDGTILKATEFQVGGEMLQTERLLSGGGYTLRVPAVDLAEVGAGGGSIVSLDAAGVPKVGPRSAGADPGPVCYGRGGAALTVTDLNLVLGYLSETSIAGGTLSLSRDAAVSACEGQLAGPLGEAAEAAAHGVWRLACMAMIQAIRAVTTERGRDPRDFSIFAFGGNGPLFAAGIAAALGARRVIVPPSPGVFSAAGLLAAEVTIHKSIAFRRGLDEAAIAAARTTADGLVAAARDELGRADGTARLSARMRYVGQSSDLVIDLGRADALTLAAARAAFEAEHDRVFRFVAPAGEPIAFTALEVAYGLGAPAAGIPAAPPGAADAGHTVQRAFFGPDTGFVDAPLVTRAAAAAGVAGPAIVIDPDATTLVPPGAFARADASGNLVIELDAARPAAREGTADAAA